MSYEILKRHREIWNQKKILRQIYADWHRIIMENIIEDGTTLEVGSGGGYLKEYYPELITSDYVYCEWLDVVLDAHQIPYRDNSLDNIIIIDVLHHLEYPYLFLQEIQRVLKNNGRLIMLEPYISPFSYYVYKYFHQEGIDFGFHAFNQEKFIEKDRKKPFDGNNAIPKIIFFKEIEKFNNEFPCLQIVKQKLLSFIFWPLSGGYEHKCFIPKWSIPFFLFLERSLSSFPKLFAFRMFLVLKLKSKQ